MEINKMLLHDYTQILMGQKEKYTGGIFSKSSTLEQKRYALDLFHYAFEIFLHWTPEEVSKKIDTNVLKKMKLYGVMEYMDLPPEVIEEEDYSYIVNKMYPNIPYDIDSLTIKVYKGILSKERYKFPKNYFFGLDGSKRACTCLRYVIDHSELSGVFHSSEDLYKFFASPDGEKVIVRNHLKTVLRGEFSDPVTYLHYTLNENERNELYYHYYRFLYERRKFKAQK